MNMEFVYKRAGMELSGEMSRVWIRVPRGNGYGGPYYSVSETRLR